MGDRSQIAVKEGDSKIYLYAHGSGNAIYNELQACIKAGARLDDPEYFARILFREMGAGRAGETGYGIGTRMHFGIEHAVPVVDCDTQEITFEAATFGDNPQSDKTFTFAEFAALDPAVFKTW